MGHQNTDFIKKNDNCGTPAAGTRVNYACNNLNRLQEKVSHGKKAWDTYHSRPAMLFIASTAIMRRSASLV